MLFQTMPPSKKPRRSEQNAPPHSADEENESATRVIPVVEEEVSIARVTEHTGDSVRVRIALHEETEFVPVTDVVEELTVERVPVNRFVDQRAEPREEGAVLIVPVYETVAVVEHRLLLKEEVRIVRHRREVERKEEVVLRKETAIVERRGADDEEWKPSPPAER
ncbi:YsnF/AvaK domain-containing protein [Azoarcus sp. PA01]|nr:YsnF/AvaK domain-containing protein [Azoarcus sp. PA01]